MSESQEPADRQRSPGTSQRRIAALEERLQDLAGDQRRLHEQLREVLDLLDDHRREEPRPSPGASTGRPPGRPPNGLARRALRSVLRSTVGLLKRLWRASDPARDWFVEVELASRSAPRLPKLGIAEPGAEPPAEAEVLSAGTPEADDVSRELVRMAFAAEDLAFLAAAPGPGSGPGVLWVRRDLWHPTAGIDRRTLARRCRGRRAVVGKRLGGRGTAGFPGMVAIGDYLVSKKHLPHVQRVRPLTGLGAPEPVSEPTLLVVLGASLTGGLERLAAGLARSLGEAYHLVVASTRVSDELQGERLEQLETLVPRVYPLADWLPADAVPSAVEVLARRHRAAAVLHLGKDDSLAAIERQLAGIDPPPPLVRAPSPAWGAALPPAGDGRLAMVREQLARAQLGVPDGAVLVTMIGDLVPRQRPEDFVALAHRCRGDGRFFFLLVGRGPLAGTIGDLERFLAPGNFRAVSAADEDDVLATTDVACALGEDGDTPAFVLAALAAGVPALATGVDGLGEILADGPCGVGVPVADLDACEEALSRMVEASTREAMGAAGRRLIERRFRLDEILADYRRLVDGATAALSESGERS